MSKIVGKEMQKSPPRTNASTCQSALYAKQYQPPQIGCFLKKGSEDTLTKCKYKTFFDINTPIRYIQRSQHHQTQKK